MTTTTSRIDVEQAAPELYRAMLRLDGAVGKSGLDPQLQDLLKFRVAQMNGCAYCMDMHGRDAVTGGERPERLYVVAGWREAGDLFDERERAALALMEEMTEIADHGVSDEVYDAAARALLRGRARGAHLPQHDDQRLDTTRGDRQADAVVRNHSGRTARAWRAMTRCHDRRRSRDARRRPARAAPPRHPARPAQRLGRGQRQGAGRRRAGAGHDQRGGGAVARLRATAATSPPTEAFAALARIVAAVDVPVTADCEAGYGLDPQAFVAGLLGAGAVGCNLEDTDHATGALRDPGENAAFLAAVKQAGRAAGVDLVLNARVDVHVRGGTLEDGLVRARAYREAGADCVYPIFCHEEEGIAAYVEAVGVINVAVHPSAPTHRADGRARRRARELRRRPLPRGDEGGRRATSRRPSAARSRRARRPGRRRGTARPGRGAGTSRARSSSTARRRSPAGARRRARPASCSSSMRRRLASTKRPSMPRQNCATSSS